MDLVCPRLFLILIIFWITNVNCVVIELGVAGILSSAGYYIYDKYKCKYSECCNNEYIPEDINGLDRILAEELYGQRIAHKTVVNALRGHTNLKSPQKALAMSFHGTPGTGKNHIAQLIAKSFYKMGSESNYYHFFNGRIDFPSEKLLDDYKESLTKNIIDSLLKCERSMFVFDEVDKMPVGLLNVLVPFLDYTSSYKSHKYLSGKTLMKNKAIFIFLSNSGGSKIVQQLMSLWEEGKIRDEMGLQDFENLIAIGAFNEKGGFHHSDTIQSSVIDHYVPFLPLEEKHVKRCIERIFLQRNVEPTSALISEVMQHVTFGPPPHNLFSKGGCKRIEYKVISIVYEKRSQQKRSEKENEIRVI